MNDTVEETRNVLNEIQAIADYGSTKHLLCIIANELADLSELIRERMPKPISGEQFEEIIKKL